MDGKDRNLPSGIQIVPLDRSLVEVGKDILGKSPTGLDLLDLTELSSKWPKVHLFL